MSIGEYWILNPADVHESDYIEAMVIDIDNVLGYGANVVLYQMVIKRYVAASNVDDKLAWTFKSDQGGISPVPANTYFQARYHSVGSTDIKLVVGINTYK